MPWDRRARCQERPALNMDVCGVGKFHPGNVISVPKQDKTSSGRERLRGLQLLSHILCQEGCKEAVFFFMRNYEMMLRKQFKERGSWDVASGKTPPLPCGLQRDCVYKL